MRNNRLACLLVVLSLAATAGVAQPPPDPELTAEFGWLGTLAGDCWRGDYASGGGDTQCYAWQYGRYLRGTIAIDAVRKDDAPFKLNGDSVFAVDAKTRRIRYASWSDTGNLLFAEAYYDGELLHFPDVKSRDEEPGARSTWRRIDADSFEVTRENRDGEQWKPGFRVVYRRVAAEAGPAPGP